MTILVKYSQVIDYVGQCNPEKIKGIKKKPAIKSWIAVKARALPCFLSRTREATREAAKKKPANRAKVNQFMNILYLYFLVDHNIIDKRINKDPANQPGRLES